MDPYSLKKFNAERRAGRSAILITDLNDGRDRVVCVADQVAGELGAFISIAFATGRGGIIDVGGHSFFLDVHVSMSATGIEG